MTDAMRRWPARMLNTLESAIRSYTQPFQIRDPALGDYYRDVFGLQSSSGIVVTDETALMCAPVYDAINQISGDLAKLPLLLLQLRKGGAKEPYTDSKLYKLLKDEPNPEMGALDFRRAVQANALIYGNGYAEIERDQTGRATALWPLDAARVRSDRDARDTLVYRVPDSKGEVTMIPARDMLHIRGLSLDGICGFSVVQKARQAIGLALAAERFGASFFGQGSVFGGVLSHETDDLDEDQKAEIRLNIEKYHNSTDKAHRFLILGRGFKYESFGVKPNDSQMDELRSKQVEEVARFFNIPVHKLKNLDRATNNNIEQQDLEYYKGCLLTWIVEWEQEVNRKLIPSLEYGRQFVKHNANAFLRADLMTRYQAHAIGRQWGWRSADDVLDLEDENPLPNGQGQIYLVPQNMWPADKITEMIKAQTAKSTPAPEEPEPELDDEPAQDDETIRTLTARAEAAEAAAADAQARAEAASLALAAAQAEGTVQADELARLLASERQAVAVAAHVTVQAEAMRAEVTTLRDALAQRQLTVASERDRIAGVLSAHRALVVDIMRRMIDRETERARRAQTTPDKLRAWMRTFYTAHEDLCVHALLPAVRVHLAWMGADDDPVQLTKALVAQHVADSQRQLEVVLDGDGDELAPSVHALCRRWEAERPTQIADRLFQKGIDHATR